MPRHFTIRRMLRLIPKSLLRPFLQRVGYSIDNDWDRVTAYGYHWLEVAVSRMPQRTRLELESKLSAIHEMACDAGIRALLEVAKRSGVRGFATRLPRANRYHQAIWAWLHYPALFEHAAFLQSAGSLTRWRKRINLPCVEPRTSKQALHELGFALSRLFPRQAGKPQSYVVEYCVRDRETDYFVAYPEKSSQVALGDSERGHLQHLYPYRSLEFAFAYSRHDGALEVFANVPSHTIAQLESLFARTILGKDIGQRPHGPPYDLNRLKDRHLSLETDPNDGLTASITRLGLRSRTWGQIGLEPDQNGHIHGIYDMVTHCLHHGHVDWSHIQIQTASFRFKFNPMQGQPAGVLDFNVDYPDHCTVRSRRPERIDLVHKYLKRWNIARA